MKEKTYCYVLPEEIVKLLGSPEDAGQGEGEISFLDPPVILILENGMPASLIWPSTKEDLAATELVLRTSGVKYDPTIDLVTLLDEMKKLN